MSERYLRLFSLPGNLYAEGAPVIVVAGALLKDNQTGGILAQLKIRNIGPKKIKGVKAVIVPNDTLGNPLGNGVEHWYLDLNINRDQDFGSKEPILCPDETTRGFSVSINEVAYSDNSSWEGANKEWESLGVAETLMQGLGGKDELVKQYKIRYGSDCKYMYKKEKDLWYCACGSLNRESEIICHSCKKNSHALSSFDITVLRNECAERLEREKRTLEKEQQIFEEEQKRTAIKKAETAAKVKKTASKAVIAVVAVGAVALIVSAIYSNVKRLFTYKNAIALMESGDYEAAITTFEGLDGYQDSEDLITESECILGYAEAESLVASGDYEAAISAFKALGDYSDAEVRVQEVEYLAAESLVASGDYEAAISAFEALGDYGDAEARVQEVEYLAAESLVASGDYEAAISAFEALGDYSDAEARVQEVEYLAAESLVASGDYEAAISAFEAFGEGAEYAYQYIYDYAEKLLENKSIYYAATAFGSLGDYKDARDKSFECWEELKDYSKTITCGDGRTMAVTSDGSVFSTYEEGAENDWTDIVAIYEYGGSVAGIKSDGTSINRNDWDIINDWQGLIKVIGSSGSHTIGLLSDGTVKYYLSGLAEDVGQCAVDSWTDIIDIAVGNGFTIGLKLDGSVISTGDNSHGQCSVSQWTNIIDIAANDYMTIGLKSDGTVVGTGSTIRYDGIEKWTDIVAISAGEGFVVGLKSDGTVVSAGMDYSIQKYVTKWTNIVAIAAGDAHVVGLKMDGTLEAAGDNSYGACEVGSWQNLKVPEN